MEPIYIGRANTIDLALMLDGVPTNAPPALNATDKLSLRLEDKNGTATHFDSLANPSYFSVIARKTQGNLLRVFSIGLGNAGLVEGDYDCVLTMFDATHTTGIVINEFRAQVREA